MARSVPPPWTLPCRAAMVGTARDSIATQTSRHSGSLADFEEKFEARIQALADVHNLLIESNWASTGLRQLIEHQLRPYAELDGVRFRTEGPELQVRPRPAVTLSLVVHELATNAAKYGALSRPGGRLEVRWRVAEEETVPALEIVWAEAGGPPVSPPERVGFGSELITFSMRYEFDGNAELAYRPEGLQCTLRMPLPSGAPIEL